MFRRRLLGESPALHASGFHPPALSEKRKPIQGSPIAAFGISGFYISIFNQNMQAFFQEIWGGIFGGKTERSACRIPPKGWMLPRSFVLRCRLKNSHCNLEWIYRYMPRCTAFDGLSIPLTPQRISCGYTDRTPGVSRPFRQEWISISLKKFN